MLVICLGFTRRTQVEVGTDKASVAGTDYRWALARVALNFVLLDTEVINKEVDRLLIATVLKVYFNQAQESSKFILSEDLACRKIGRDCLEYRFESLMIGLLTWWSL